MEKLFNQQKINLFKILNTVAFCKFNIQLLYIATNELTKKMERDLRK